MSGALETLAIISALVDLLQTAQRLAPALSAEIQAVGALVKQAQTEGRDLTPADRMAVTTLVNAARDRAAAAIARMEAEAPK